MKMRSQLEQIFTKVLSTESFVEIQYHLEQKQFNIRNGVSIIEQVIDLYLDKQIAIENDFLRLLGDDELFELGFTFGFEGKYSRWRMIEDLGVWFSANIELFNPPEKASVEDLSHREILKTLSFSQLNQVTHILNVKYKGSSFFHNLEDNHSSEEVKSKLSLVNKELLLKAMNELEPEMLNSAQVQIELELDSPQNKNELELAYEILEVHQKHSNIEIKKSFFKKARDFHPDSHAPKNLDEQDQKLVLDNFRNVKKAFEVIKDSRPGPW